jgi:hypothetical protein
LDHLLFPIESLRQGTEFFARVESLRLLHVVADPELLGPALDVIRAIEWSPENRRAVFVIEDQLSNAAERWTARTDRLLAGLAAIRAAYAKTGIDIPDIALPPEGEPPIQFARALRAASESLCRPPAQSAGIIAIVATSDPAGGEEWLRFLDEALRRTPSLADVRWCWLESGQAVGDGLVSALGSKTALHLECRIDTVRQREELDDLLSAMAQAPDDAAGPAAAGAAGPTVAPPPHPTDPPKTGNADGEALQATRAFLHGLQAVRAGDMNEAVRLQTLAFHLFQAGSDPRLAAEMELLLATYLVQAAGGKAASLRPALSVFERASEHAYRLGLSAVGGKIDLVMAPLAKLAGELELAGRGLRRAADRTKDCAPALSIEALRMAADLVLASGNRAKAAELLGEAVAVAATLPEAEARQTSAASCAESLAGLLREQRQGQRAVEMDDLAKRLRPP